MKGNFPIDSILVLLETDDNVNPKSTPVTQLIHCKDKAADLGVRYWNYRAAIGIFNYLQASTRPEIVVAVYQCARFLIKYRVTHERVVMRLGKYLLRTRDRLIDLGVLNVLLMLIFWQLESGRCRKYRE